VPDIGGQKHHQRHIFRVEPPPRLRRHCRFNDKGPTAWAGGFVVPLYPGKLRTCDRAATERADVNELHMSLLGAVSLHQAMALDKGWFAPLPLCDATRPCSLTTS
jgi:hypothetical protein